MGSTVSRVEAFKFFQTFQFICVRIVFCQNFFEDGFHCRTILVHCPRTSFFNKLNFVLFNWLSFVASYRRKKGWTIFFSLFLSFSFSVTPACGFAFPFLVFQARAIAPQDQPLHSQVPWHSHHPSSC